MLTLLHGLERHRPPESGRLRGQEFKEAVSKLKQIIGVPETAQQPSNTNRSGTADNSAPQRKESSPIEPTPLSSGEMGMANMASTPETNPSPSSRGEQNETANRLVNVPLRRHDKEAARALENLYEDLIVDVSQMSPEAAAYVRKRPWMTPELLRKWGCGWIPGNGRSLFRKNYFVYTHRNVRGDVVSYSGRDLTFEKKWDQWIKDGKPEGKKPNKHRYVAGYHRGIELFGAMVSRLEEPQLQESLKQNGLVVVEGMNDVIRLDELGICAVGLCSNRATETQIDAIVRFAKQVANNRVLLFPDNDPEGEAGFKELLWELSKREMSSGLVGQQTIEASQPEYIQEWTFINLAARSM